MSAEWNVYRYNMNRRKIEPFNIFDHWSFSEDVKKYKKKCKDKDEFAEELKHSLFYYFWSKAEYEVLISPWCGGSEKDAVKIDVYSQVMLNWDKFVEYVWNADIKE